MTLEEFLTFTSDGAWGVFDRLVGSLSVTDLKALRHCVNQPVRELLFPYMFERLFFSIHEEDHDVFRYVLSKKKARPHVVEIFWDTSICTHHTDGVTRHGSLIQYEAALDKITGGSDFGIAGERVKQTVRQASHFWEAKRKYWLGTAASAIDLALMKRAFNQLPNLRRITVLSENMHLGILTEEYSALWPSPRLKLWKELPFYDILMEPRPFHLRHMTIGLDRLKTFLSFLTEKQTLTIGTIIYDFYFDVIGGTHNGFGPRPIVDFDKVLNGYGRSVPNPSDPKKLTLRLLIEIPPHTCGEYDNNIPRSILNLFNISAAVRDSLEDVTYCRADICNDVLDSDDSDEELIHCPQLTMLAKCWNLRAIRFYDCWVGDMYEMLLFLWQKTTIKKIELCQTVSMKSRWNSVFIKLKAKKVAFEWLNISSCCAESDSGISVDPGKDLPTLSGSPEDIAAWLKGQTARFPLRYDDPINGNVS